MDDQNNDYHLPRQRADSLRPVSDCLPDLAKPAGDNLAALAVLRATRLFGCYRKDEAADPDVYLTGVVAILTHYGIDTIEHVTDPYSGLPAHCKWLPTLQEVREACDQHHSGLERTREREKALREQFALRAKIEREEADRAKRPTLEEMKAKYGPTWGIGTEEPERQHPTFARYTNEQLRTMYPGDQQ